MLIDVASLTASQQNSQFDLLAVEVLRGDLRKGVELALGDCVEARVAVAEVDRRVPHLKIEKFPSLYCLLLAGDKPNKPTALTMP